MKNKTYLILGLSYAVVNPILIYWKGGFWLLILELFTILIGLLLLSISISRYAKFDLIKLIVGLIPIIIFQVLLNLPDKQIHYTIPNNFKGYVIILFEQPEGISLNSSFTEINYEIPLNGVLLIKDKIPSSFARGNCISSTLREVSIIDWQYVNLGGFCNRYVDYSTNAIYFCVDSTNIESREIMISKIEELICGNTLKLNS